MGGSLLLDLAGGLPFWRDSIVAGLAVFVIAILYAYATLVGVE